MFFSEIGPKSWGYKQFRVRNLPEQKVADPKFTTGANQQLRIWDA
jgi:hypothetical protein